MSSYRAAGTGRRHELRPLTTHVPLRDVSPDEAAREYDDYRDDLLQAELAEDRMLEHAGTPWPPADVVAFPARGPVERQAA